MIRDSGIVIVPSFEMEEGAGARVKRLMPTPFLRHHDPFVLFDEFYVDGKAGFPDHPHRGFEIITYMLEGAFIHRDSLGNELRIDEGGIQYITVGRGLVHAEMPGSDGMNHGIQLWINLARKDKKQPPAYRDVPAEDIPEHVDENYRERFIAGDKGAVQLFTPIEYRHVIFETDGIWRGYVPDGWQGFVYNLKGEIDVQDVLVPPHHAALLRKSLVEIKVHVHRSESEFLWIVGQAHNEPIRQWGPFVD